MSEERERVRCRNCELVQWRNRELCRRCGVALPEPIVKIVERFLQRIVFQPASEIAAESQIVRSLTEAGTTTDFLMMAEMERSMILTAYQRSNRSPLLAARHREDHDVSQAARVEERSLVHVLS